MKLKETITEQRYWPSLFGKVDTVTVSSVIKMMYRKTVKDTEIRIKYACLALLESVLLLTSLKMKISRDHVEAIKDLDAFFAYPWGRVAFDMLMGSIKERDEIALSQNTIAIKGFVLALQLVMVEAVPALTDVVQDTCSSSESDSEDVDGHGRDIFCKKQTLNPAHARNVDKRIDVLVNSVLVEDPAGPINAGNLVYSDEEHDARVESMLVRISRSHCFNNSDFPSGLKKSDVDRMREVVKSTTKPKRAKKFQSNAQDSETSYIVQVVLEKIKSEVASMERNIKVATSGVEAIEQKVGVYVETLLEKFKEEMLTFVTEKVSTLWKEHIGSLSGAGTIPTSPTKEVSVPATHSSPDADVNAMTIQNVLRDISQYSTPPRSNRMSEAGNLTPSNKAHAGSGYVCVTPVLQSCAQSANSENRSRQNSFHQRLEALIPVEVPILPTNQVHHQEPIADINVGYNNEEGQSSWRSKRQKTVPSGLVCDYQCDPHLLARLRESQRCIFVIQDISEQTRKYAKLVTKLQGKFVFNILGLAVSAKELLLIVDRPRTYSAKVFDILIRVLRSVMTPLLPPQGSRSAAFLDTKFVPSIMRTFPKFLKSKNKEGYLFPKGLTGIFPSKEAPMLHPTRYACQPLGAEPVIQCYDVARPKSVAQSKVHVDSGLMALLMMAYHALYGLDACKTITRELLEEEGKSAAILAYEFKEKL
ncbi:uncharacterized protein LOC103847747 [Brassica rapa]|uniref:uncharacterized protein LOC103847747 n=1 Tax=Brassica campestris TaxID=3711 RepID=UPI00142D34D6|nr:uncharacterized protein LOC103847747 [Brassica rapa]